MMLAARVSPQRRVQRWSKPLSGGPTTWPTPTLLPLQTLVPLNEGTSHDPPLFIVHPIEGLTHVLEELATQLPCHVFGLQCTADAHPLESIQALASFYLQAVREVSPKGPYCLAGYSFGGCVALEMALQLQQQVCGDRPSPVQTLVMLDSSHLYVMAHTSTYKAKVSHPLSPQAESMALCSFLQQLTDIDFTKTFEELEALPCMDARLEYVADWLKQGPLNFLTDVREAALRYYRRLVIGDGYSPQAKFKGNVTLVRAKLLSPEARGLENDYGLHEVCSGTVEVHHVDGDHYSILQDAGAKAVAEILQEKVQGS